jgi:hypothetical protein
MRTIFIAAGIAIMPLPAAVSGPATETSQTAAATWTVEDANEKWTCRAPQGWYGGSYYQIKERLSLAQQDRQGPPQVAAILRMLGEQARSMDAILLHLESSLDGSRGDGSLLKIRTTPHTGRSDQFPGISELSEETWKKYAGRLLSSTSGARDVQLLGHRADLTAQGVPAATASFRIKTDGDDRYEGLVILYRRSGVTSFLLESPFHVSARRMDDVWSMVRSMRFSDGSSSADGERVRFEASARAVLAPFLNAGGGRQRAMLALQPLPADYARILKEPLATRVRNDHRDFWNGLQVISHDPDETELQLIVATTDDLIAKREVIDQFPGGYRDLAAWLQPGLRVARFRFVRPGRTLGTAYDGLFYLDGRWVFVPKAWRSLPQ